MVKLVKQNVSDVEEERKGTLGKIKFTSTPVLNVEVDTEDERNITLLKSKGFTEVF